MAKPIEQRMTLKDQVTPTMRNINKGTVEYKRNLKDLKAVGDKTWSSIKVGAAGVAASIGTAAIALAGFGIKTNAEMEKSALSFEILLQSAEKAKSMVSDLQALAVESPFEFTGLQNSAKKLLGMGFASEQIIPILHSLGNTVAAVGGDTEQMEGIALALGQIQSKGKVSAEEINQLAERGVPAWQLLSEQMGMSTSELMKMSEQGKLLANDAIPMLIKRLDERFGGSMDRMSNTFDFTLANIKESLNLTFAQISFPLFEQIKTDLQGLRGTMEQMREDGSMQEWGNKISSALLGIYNTAKVVGTVILSISEFFINNWSLISPVIYGIVTSIVAYQAALIVMRTWNMAVFASQLLMTSAQLGLNAAMKANPIGMVVTLLGLLVMAGTYVVQNWEQVKLMGMNVWNSIVEAAEWGVNMYIKFANFMFRAYKFAWDSIKFAGMSIWDAIIGAGEAGVNGFIGLVEKMIEKALGGINNLIKGANNISENLGMGKIANEITFSGLGRVDFSGSKTNAVAPKWDNDFNLIPTVDFSKAKFSDDSIMSQTKKAQAERDKKRQNSEDKLIEALNNNTAVTSDNTKGTGENTKATAKNTSALREAESAEGIADKLFGRIERQIYATT